MIRLFSFIDVPRESFLAIEVKQEGEAHAVRGALERQGTRVNDWVKGELEDSVTRTILEHSGLYQLVLFVAFFGRDEESVTIDIGIESSAGSRQQHQQFVFEGMSGAMQTLVVAISVS
jgi:hypothetical protein